ncbi:hypothetical protein HCN44_004821 [Aphidius gifuensis]|uniref:Uncharacterized protein n=1 Tax=Aphidius gifuensis TaxID=684658 RepID=A0A835CQP8_APHGI|nr:hypothetical protein HCN44_004821 [Aphidius gifuensis]
MNEFTEVTQIFITLHDICNTHTLLLKYDIRPSENDEIHELLNDIKRSLEKEYNLKHDKPSELVVNDSIISKK